MVMSERCPEQNCYPNQSCARTLSDIYSGGRHYKETTLNGCQYGPRPNHCYGQGGASADGQYRAESKTCFCNDADNCNGVYGEYMENYGKTEEI